MDDVHGKSKLLSLPRELRDQIYLYAIQQHWSPPERAFRVVPQIGSNDQFYSLAEAGKWQHPSLLLVNHQVRAEVDDVITQCYRHHEMRLELDVIAKGYMYTPKWTYLNLGLRPQSNVNLAVNLQILSTEAFRRDSQWPRHPGFMFRELLRLLNLFIFTGPSFLEDDPSRRTLGPFYIEVLVVRVSFQDWYTEETWPEAVHEIFRMLKSLSLLDTCHKYIGQIRVEAEYLISGKYAYRERTFTAATADESLLREVDWSDYGLKFGQAWLEKYKTRYNL